jgi:hypothetical protein
MERERQLERVRQLQEEEDRIMSELEAQEVDEDVSMRGNVRRTPQAEAARLPLAEQRAHVQAQLDELAKRSPIVAAARRAGQQAPFRQLNFPPSPESPGGSVEETFLPYPGDEEEAEEEEEAQSMQLPLRSDLELPMRRRGTTRRSVPAEYGPNDLPKVVAKRRRETEPVGFAQRLRYKFAKKIQGLASEIDRLQTHPTQREQAVKVNVKGTRMTLRDSRIEQCMREARNLKADLQADGFAQYLMELPAPQNNHYLPPPASRAYSMRWFQTNVQPQLTHEERTGLSQQYVGNSRRGYRFAK